MASLWLCNAIDKLSGCTREQSSAHTEAITIVSKLLKVYVACKNSFTGGDTGISISRKAGMIPLQMELGGKDACIVLEDADLDLAASNIVKGGYSYRSLFNILALHFAHFKCMLSPGPCQLANCKCDGSNGVSYLQVIDCVVITQCPLWIWFSF